MVVCKFFQHGYCRFGQNCRNEHVFGSKFSYHANAPAQAAPAQPTTGVTDEQLMNQVQTDVQAILNGNQWILSAYAPYKEKPCFPGLSDLSPEEARLFIYEAKANNNLEQVVGYINNLFKEARYKYELLTKPNINIIKTLRSLYNGEIVPSPFPSSSSTFGNSNASSIFRSAAQNTSNVTPVFVQNSNATPSVFNQQPGVFGQNPDQAKSIFAQAVGQTQNTFAPQTTDNIAAKSIFAQASQNIFGVPNQNPPSIFGNQNAFAANPTVQSNPANLFASASQNIFGQNEITQSPFGQNVFQKPEASQTFGQNVFQIDNSTNSTGVYSQLGDITELDLEAFKADDFELGFVPEIAPPKELCI